MKALIVAGNLSFPAGGPIYSMRIIRELCHADWQLGVWTNQSIRDPGDGRHPIQFILRPAFFRHGQNFGQKIARRRDELSLIQLVRRTRPDVCLVLGDRPRGIYRILKRFTRVIYFMHDVSATCPQEGGLRILDHTHRICTCRAGLSCLSKDKTENCLGQRPLWRKLQRIARTRRELATMSSIGEVVVNSSYVASVARSNCRRLVPQTLEPVTDTSTSIVERDASARFNLLYLGRVESYKGIFEAIEILAGLPSDYRLTIVGTGDDESAARSRAKELSVDARIEFAGWQQGSDRERFMQRSGLLLMPTLAAEAFGMAGPEALSASMPVVAYDVGGVSSWCDGIAARCVLVGDRAAAIREILAMTSHERAWRQLCLDARAYAVARFNESQWRKQLFDLLSQRRCA